VDVREELDQRDGVREFLDVIRRRKLALLLPIVLTPIIALGNTFLQDPVYAASADVLVTNGSVGSALSDLPGLSSPDQPERNARTQVGLARLPRVAQRVIDAAPLFEDSTTFLRRSSVSVPPDADILRFTVEDAEGEQAARLATIYAREFTQYRNSLDVEAIRNTRAKIQRALAKLVASGGNGTQLESELQQAIRQLNAAEAVQGSAAIVVQPAVGAEQIAPRPKRDFVLAIALGTLLGIGLAFLVERLDTRLRTTEEIESILGLPVVGEVPTPPELPRKSRTSVAMLEFPYGPYAEGIRKLRANVEFVNLDLGARTVMVTSALAGEGKTTTAADLAVALARSGRKVAFCDLDSRSPTVGAAFGLVGQRGLAEVAFGLASLDRVLVSFEPASETTPSVPRDFTSRLPDAESADDLVVQSHHDSKSRGELHVLPFGRVRPPSPADFVGSSSVRHVVAELARTHDIVIVDTPPTIPVSDALTISEYVDAAIVVTRLASSQRPTLRSLRKLLATFRTPMLGLVVTGVAEEEGYGPYFVRGPAPAEPIAHPVR
jgi:Mrp family chromosome partitioning ATPase